VRVRGAGPTGRGEGDVVQGYQIPLAKSFDFGGAELASGNSLGDVGELKGRILGRRYLILARLGLRRIESVVS
jgi:hypothetical protein